MFDVILYIVYYLQLPIDFTASMAGLATPGLGVPTSIIPRQLHNQRSHPNAIFIHPNPSNTLLQTQPHGTSIALECSSVAGIGSLGLSTPSIARNNALGVKVSNWTVIIRGV
jgi:hypothetical protein